MKIKFYKLLIWMGSDRVTDSSLKKFPKELIEEAIKEGYIIVCGKDSWGENLYMVTPKGKAKRDN